MRILHLADVHLDRPFSRADRAAGDQDRARLRDAFRRCLEIAREREADAVTIGGDLWEDEHVSADTRRFVAAELTRLDRPVLIVTGNHDRLLEGGNYERTDWPDDVALFRTTHPEPVQLTEEVSIWGASWTHEDPTADPLRERLAPDDGRTHLLLLHGTATPLAALTEDSGHCPFEPQQVSAAGFDLCLAGHIHAASHKEAVVYPGSPEPLGWGQTGGHGVALIDVTGDGCQVELIDANTHSYEEIEVDCSGATHGAECEQRLATAIQGRGNEALHLRATLTGEIARECEVDPEQIAARNRDRFAELQVRDETTPAFDLDALAARPDATGHFVQLLQDRIAAASDEREHRRLESALEYGLRALDGTKVSVNVD